METEKIQRSIDANKKEHPDYQQILDLLGKIMIKQAESSGKTRVEPVSVAEDVVRAKLKKGKPVLSKEDFPVDVPGASELFKELCEILSSENEDLSDEIAKIESSLEKRELVLEEMFQSVLTDERQITRLSERLSLDRDVMLTLATASLKPSLEATASHLSSLLEDAPWSGLCCPMCGSSQAISELREPKQDGIKDVAAEGAERILHCSFCGSEWRTTRLGCTFCGNTDTESLKYLYIEGRDGYRIDVCGKCKRYIKTVDRRAISHEVVPAVEDMATLHLDIIAEEEGYRREAWFMPYCGV